jgi:hypothetical protein
MKLDRCCVLIDKHLRPELAGNLRASWQPEQDRLSSLCAGVSLFLRSKRAFFVMSTEAETSLTISLVMARHCACLRLL